MRLKRRDEIQWNDLPKIESPFFALAWARDHIDVNGNGLHWVAGLTDVVPNELGQVRRTWDDHDHRLLLDELERAELFLIHGFGSDPVLPVVKRTNNEGEAWHIEDSLSQEARFHVDWMLRDILRTREETRG